MVQVRLGKTEIVVEKNSFGALPIQRISTAEAVKLLRKAYDHGVTFFDTARFYTDSECKLGEAFDSHEDRSDDSGGFLEGSSHVSDQSAHGLH